MRRPATRLGAEGDGQTATSHSRSTRTSPTTGARRSSRRQRFHEEVDRPNLFVKIPGRSPGSARSRTAIARGKLDQRDADLRARPVQPRSSRRTSVGSSGSSRTAATPPSSLSVASFFVSRVDTEADKRLEALGTARAAGQARDREREARLPHYHEAFSGDRWDAPRGERGLEQRCLWASTSTKNPAYRDVLYVEELVGPGYREHDARRDHRGLPGSRRGTRCDADRGRRGGAVASRRARERRGRLRTTSSTRSSRKGCRSSPTPSPSCSRASRRSSARSPHAE